MLDDHFDIGEIRVTAGSGDGLRSDQDWDVYTSSDSGSTWNALRMDNILFDGPGGHGKGTTITLTDSTGILASNVDAIKFDIFGAGGGTSYHAAYQEIDIFVPEPSTMALAAFGLLGLVGFGRRRKR